MATQQEKDFFNDKSFTVQARILHPNLLTASAGAPRPGQQPKAPNFSVMVVWPENSNHQTMPAMRAFIDQAFATFHQGCNRAVMADPIKDSSYQRQDGKPNPDYTQGCLWVNANSGEKFPPTIVGMDRNPVMTEAEIYSGMNALVNLSFYNMTGANGTKRGVGVNIKAVMLQEGGERLVGSAAVDINAVFGQFQGEMGLPPQQPTQAPALNDVGMPSMPQQQPAQAPAQQYQQPAQAPAQQYQQPAQAPAQQYQQPAQQPAQQQYQQPAQAPAQQGVWTPDAQPEQPAQAPNNNPFAPNNGQQY